MKLSGAFSGAFGDAGAAEDPFIVGLDELFEVKVNGRRQKMSAKEIELNRVLMKAMDKNKPDFKSIAYLLDLFEKYDCDAALMHDFSGIYVDAEAYIIWEKGPRWKQRRLRFSVAHELGHYVLHREIASKINFTIRSSPDCEYDPRLKRWASELATIDLIWSSLFMIRPGSSKIPLPGRMAGM